MSTKMMKPYWFLESPVDEEHKFYILMDFLTKSKKQFKTKGFEKRFKEILTVKRNLESFDKDTEFTQRTQSNMTEVDTNRFYELLDKNLNKVEEIEKIVKTSLDNINKFLDENKDQLARYNSLVAVESYCNQYHLWDSGFLVVRKSEEEFMKIFSWFFSVITIGGEEKIALLMTEMLDPQCETTLEINKIRRFLKANTKNFSDKLDCVLIADVSKDIDIVMGTEIGKEKSIDLILKNFKND